LEQAITALGKDRIVGVYAANDGTAGGAIAAMKGNGVDPIKTPVTGQDAELAAIQRIVAGEQFMTVSRRSVPRRTRRLIWPSRSSRARTPKMTETVNNGNIDVPAKLLTPVAVTKDNIMDTVVKDGFHKVADICSGQFADACAKAGIK
jgi:D-xylose transport system substrate-binding protein